ncbi:hypothetical protein AB0F17_23535 [Nonomuraea sp. NPDC026600]|uniref:hypothetical protein n=1 Tax=Nonomuraea sp. NPDC026600 TaxID=3155363 RepID=UPI0033CF806C
MFRSISAVCIAIPAALAILAPAAANAQSSTSQAAAACRTIQVTGGKVAIREFPFTNGEILATVPHGTLLTSCGFLRGNGSNGYEIKCGSGGHDWYAVRSRTGVTGHVPATCVRVI